MRSRIITAIAALALGAAFASVPAIAQQAPLSPGGVTAAADSFGGPGYSGPQGHPQADGKPASYSSTGPGGAPLSPGGVTAAADSFGGPGYNR